MATASDPADVDSCRLPLSLDAEFDGMDLGRSDTNKRARQFARAHALNPDKPYPRLATSPAEVQAFYNLLTESGADPQDILDPHFRQTVSRCHQSPRVVVAHDTSTMKFDYDSDRDCLGYIDSAQRGFLFHPSLAIDPENFRPLGLLAFKTWSRPKPTRKVKKPTGGSTLAKRAFKDKESARWVEQVEVAEQRIKGLNCTAIHVFDQEGDNYGILSRMIQSERHFVVRVHYDRQAKASDDDDWGKLSDLLKDQDLVIDLDVPISERKVKKKSPPKGRRAPRTKRIARLQVSRGSVIFRRPSYGEKKLPAAIKGNLVRLLEINPPKGEAAIEWLLFTTEAIDSVEAVLSTINAYRARWLIEEFFSAIKTGCAYKKRELTTLKGLERALAFSAPVAWFLLMLRNAARTEPLRPARMVLSDQQIDLLRRLSTRVKLGAEPTIEEAMYAIAGLGGHCNWNGPPGWLILERGLEALLQAEMGWIAAQKALAEQHAEPGPPRRRR